MPHVVVYNLPKSEYKDNKLTGLEAAICKAFLGIPELGLSKEDISFSFPLDPSVMKRTDSIPIVIIVELLLHKPKRTYDIRKKLAYFIAYQVTDVLIAWRWFIKPKIEVAIKRFDPDYDGFFVAH